MDYHEGFQEYKDGEGILWQILQNGYKMYMVIKNEYLL